jgi:hypothetical protein
MELNIFEKIIHPLKAKPIILVSGLPRSGTSMMMSMLKAGGLEILSDDIRTPDANNPKGYYELERVKKLQEGDIKWLSDAPGKVVKIISALLKYLPDKYSYKIIFMQRDMDEILISQRRMLERDGKVGDNTDDQVMAELFEKHLNEVDKWLKAQKKVQVLKISYNDVLRNPRTNIKLLNDYLGNNLDISKMLEVIEPKLYRERKQ